MWKSLFLQELLSLHFVVLLMIGELCYTYMHGAELNQFLKIVYKVTKIQITNYIR